MRKLLLVLLAGLTSLPALAAPTAAPVIDNDRVTVWDITLAMGQATPPRQRTRIPSSCSWKAAAIQTAMAGGTTITASRKFGDAMLIPKGSAAVDTLVSGGPAHEIVVAIKDHAELPVTNPAACRWPFPAPARSRYWTIPG